MSVNVDAAAAFVWALDKFVNVYLNCKQPSMEDRQILANQVTDN